MSSKDFEKEQTWWHFEDQIRPSEVRMVKQVMDIYTDEEFLEVDFGDMEVSNLMVRSKNPEKSLAFIWKELTYLNLGKLDVWPLEMNVRKSKKVDSSKKRHHLRLELKYIDLKPQFRKSPNNPFDGYKSTLKINGPIQPEISFIVPKGMKMEADGSSINGYFYRVGENMAKFPLEFKKPAITKKEDKTVYTYVIKGESYQKIISTPKISDSYFRIQYSVKNERKFILLFMVSVILAIYALDELYRTVLAPTLYTPYTPDLPNIGLLIVLFSLSGLILTLRNENYEIIGEKAVITSIILTLGVVALILVTYLFSVEFNHFMN